MAVLKFSLLYFLESQVIANDVKARFVNFSYTLSSGWWI